MIRTAIYYRNTPGHHSTELVLQQAVEDRGGVVVATYIDDDSATIRTRSARWAALLADLDAIDQVVVSSAVDLPGKSVRDLLKVLRTLRDNSVDLYLHRERIDTSCGSVFTVLDIGEAYRRGKLSQAIRIGQARSVAAGKIIGRPRIRPGIVTRIQTCLAEGAGIRSTARRFNVSPASVVNIRRSTTASHQQAAESPAHLQARAEELHRTAMTAKAVQMVTALVTPAERFEAFALRRSAERGIDQSSDDILCVPDGGCLCQSLGLQRPTS